MSKLKPIHKDAIARAFEKAERYRLLNEPFEAGSKSCMWDSAIMAELDIPPVIFWF